MEDANLQKQTNRRANPESSQAVLGLSSHLH
jgi:hypothetical protein